MGIWNVIGMFTVFIFFGFVAYMYVQTEKLREDVFETINNKKNHV